MKLMDQFQKYPDSSEALYFVKCHADGTEWSYVATFEDTAKRISEEAEWSLHDVKEALGDSFEGGNEMHTMNIKGEQWGAELTLITEFKRPGPLFNTKLTYTDGIEDKMAIFDGNVLIGAVENPTEGNIKTMIAFRRGQRPEDVQPGELNPYGPHHMIPGYAFHFNEVVSVETMIRVLEEIRLDMLRRVVQPVKQSKGFNPSPCS
jgi:hypothetical protein